MSRQLRQQPALDHQPQEALDRRQPALDRRPPRTAEEVVKTPLTSLASHLRNLPFSPLASSVCLRGDSRGGTLASTGLQAARYLYRATR
jgi:hypothetical protein